MAPNQVNSKKLVKVLQNLYGKSKSRVRMQRKCLKIGTNVRIRLDRGPFRKGYLQTYSEVIYTIKDCFLTIPYTYLLESPTGISLPSLFYREELTPVSMPQEFGHKSTL